MDDIIRLRDHERPCEHGSLWPHAHTAAKSKWWQGPDCPGGREMVFQRVGDGVWSEIEDPGDPVVA
jgi:hypothetical protein